MEKVFNKLVRDKIPEIIKDNGEEAITRILSLDEYKTELYKKLEEEKNEVVNSKDNIELQEEIADLYEVIDSIISAYGISKEEIEKIKETKKTKRGGFDDRVFLIKTKEKQD